MNDAATMSEPRPRVLIIGLDGATFDLLQPMAAQGWLPRLSQVFREGCRGVLRSTLPPLTAPAWSSFLTGMTPGGHGVFSFQQRLDSQLQRRFVNSTDLQAPRLWHWLAQAGLTTGSINVPMTWPPHSMPVGSYLVTGMLTPSTESPFTYPPQLADELRAMSYVCDLRVKLHERDFRTAAGVTAIARDLQDVLRKREHAILKLLQEHPTDVLAVVFETPDRLQHWAWNVIEELLANDGGLDRTALHEAVQACYEELDRVVGRLLDQAIGDRTYVFFVSDHGFGPLRSRFHVDAWLADQGWLTYAHARATLRQRLRGPFQRVKRFLPGAVLRTLLAPLLARGREALAVTQIIDWPCTQAYSGRAMEHAIYVNLQGREPHGIVELQECDRLRRQICQALLALRDPETGLPVVEAAHLREDAYEGPYTSQAPDIVFRLAPGYEPTSELSTQGILSNALEEGAGIHQPDGIFMALGPGIRPGIKLPVYHIEDVLPTVMYALGLPVPTALEGVIIKAAFEPGYLADHPPVYASQPMPTDVGGWTGPTQAYSAQDAERVEERLAALGYLD